MNAKRTNNIWSTFAPIQMQNTLNELINWSAVLMVNEMISHGMQLQSYLSIIHFSVDRLIGNGIS